MRGVKRVLLVLVLLLVALAVLGFVLGNQQLVGLSILAWTTPQLPVSVFVVIALLMGLVVGPFLGWLYGRMTSRKSALPR